jgi:glycosyltransferase involved in cell wall biosynthesis
MKILCIIDSLGSGGAQRQMVNLALGLKAKGHAVELFVYFPELRFFRPRIDAVGIPVHEVTKGRGFSFKVVWALLKLYRSSQFDGVISFLDKPNIYAELAKMFSLLRIKLVVSERSSFINERKSIHNNIKRWLYLTANYVVTNSHAQSNWLRKHSWLREKVHTIYNGYIFDPAADFCQLKGALGDLSLLSIGRIDSGKNGIGLLQGLIRFYQKYGDCPTLLWAGRQDQDPSSLKERQNIDELLTQYPVIAHHWQFLGERRDIQDLLHQADALIHVSLYEGLPNAVCEAFIAARPVIASNVCDHPLLVEDGVRGFLCDPFSSESICEAIERFLLLNAEGRQQMRFNARSYANQYLTVDRMVSDYEALFLGSR